MLTKRTIVVCTTLATVLILGLSGVALGTQLLHKDQDILVQLEKQCTKAVDEDGYGSARLSDTNIQNETGTLSVPCRIHLKPGSTLQMNHVQWTTQSLLIDSDTQQDASSGKAVHVVLNHSSLNGARAGFLLQLRDTASTVAIADTVFDYSQSISIGVSNNQETDPTARLDVQRSIMRSKGADTEGITLVTTGKAVFRDNKFELNDPNDIAVLLGDECVLANNINANDRCHGPD